MIEIHVTGLDTLAHACTNAAAHLPNEVVDGMSQGLDPVQKLVRASALATLPHSGGLAARVAGSRFSKQRHGNSIRLQASNSMNINAMDKGTVFHPVYGHGPIIRQAVPPGWWTKPTAAAESPVHKGASTALDKVVAKI